MNIIKTENGYKSIVRIRGASGKIVERRCYGRTKEALKAEIERVKAEVRSGKVISRSLTVCNFSELLTCYKEKKGVMSSSHLRKISYLEKEVGSYRVDDFADRFEAWLKIERQSARNRHGSPIRHGSSPAKGNRFIEIARAAFNIGVAMNIVSANPITKERFPKQKEIARDAVLTPEKEAELLQIVDKEQPHLSQIVRFALRVPSRKSELVNLRIEDVDLINGRVRIRNEQSKTKRGILKPIPPELKDYFYNLPKDTEYVFFKRFKNGVIKPLGDFRRTWNKCLKKAGLTGFVFHSTRHVSATRMIDNGTPPQAVQAIAGWSTDMLKVYYSRDQGHALKQVKWDRQTENCEGNVKVKEVSQ